MLTEERFNKILSVVEREGSVEVADLMAELGASESTVRRDLSALDAKGLLVKVRGGAISNRPQYSTVDAEFALRQTINVDAKKCIAAYAQSLITDDDVVYLDAGSTTDFMIDTGINRNALYVTNAISHAKKLASLDCKVYLLGGEFKFTTEAIVGEEAVLSIDKYNFTKAFLGTNGVTEAQGLTTPEIKESMIKRRAATRAKEVFVLADSSKFDQISTVTFATLDEVIVLTEKVKKNYESYKNIKEVEK